MRLWNGKCIKDYQTYLLSAHWKRLKSQLIYSNSRAACFLCGISYKLLLHHVSYDNLGHERLKRDLFILCYDCHNRAHFWHFLWIFKIKIPLKSRYLRKRLYYLKISKCIQSGKIIASAWFMVKWIIT